MTLRIIWFFILIDVIIDARKNCGKNDIHFEKVLGLKPSDRNVPLLLYKPDTNATTPITTQCLEKCQSNKECQSFVIYFNISICYWFRNAITGTEELELDSDTAWFIKICLKAPNCEKLWIFERVPGATLVGSETKALPSLTRLECQQSCLNERQFDCKSAKFKINSNYGPSDDIKGTCILSNIDRHVMPAAYRASTYDDEYFENQCSKAENEDEDEFCTYEEYDNATLGHSDLFFQNQTKDSCKSLCEKTQIFNCRGYSVVERKRSFDCYLHSEDSKVHGPRLVQNNFQGRYFEKAPCLNISITCSETYMTVEYTPDMNFLGRMYMEGYSENLECFAKGHGTETVALKLPIISEQCGIIKAIAPDNRTLLAGTMILQFNPLVQTQGDRIIRVGCIYGNDSKVLLGTGITITTAPSHVSPLINSTALAASPVIEMLVLDAETQKEVSSTQIGQELELIIEFKQADGSLDIWAGHLVAMTEHNDESIILLDDRGCPTNINIFPALTKIATNDSIKLVAKFQAFKFSSSPIVRFSVIVQFCPENCPPVDCGNNVQSFGRKQREVQTRAVHTIDGTKVTNVNRSEFEKDRTVMKMPLEFIMIVRNPGVNSERLVLGDGKILVAGYDFISNEVCLDYSLFIGLIITWVLIQIIFITCCIILVRRYKKYYEHESLTQSLEQLNKNFGIGFSNLDGRRVHWADNGDYT
ncbi:uncharacterized protein LOC123009553 isoform X2 [Tribolium madens]|uniref:uncharacterized protein LOC123009553 isoform X2 n=1 Tax=Tribolium madens TaxID=41895 RepID=UPI001CF756AA|nr:uncharacterized protein LOC123009553 isoform X2 [Tribolium madens]